MKTLESIFEDFSDFGDRVAFSLIDGTYYEGYFFEMSSDSFSFFIGGPLAPKEPIDIKYDTVDLNSLSFVKFSEHGWKDAKWNTDTNKWEIFDVKLKNIDDVKLKNIDDKKSEPMSMNILRRGELYIKKIICRYKESKK